MAEVLLPFTDVLSRMIDLYAENSDNEDEEEDLNEIYEEEAVLTPLINILQGTEIHKEEEEERSDINTMKTAKDKRPEVDFERYDAIIEKCKAKIFNQATGNTKALWKYLAKQLASNIPLLLYILLECLEVDLLLMIRIAEIIRLVRRNFDLKFLESFESAMYTYRTKKMRFRDCHALLLHILYSTYVLSAREAIVLLQIYYGECFIVDPNTAFTERLKFPREETAKFNRQRYLLEEHIRNLEKMIDDYRAKEQDQTMMQEPKISGSNDVFTEAIQEDQVNKNARRYSSKYMAVSTIVYIYGPKAYNFLRKFFPLPHEKTLRKWFSPEIQLYLNSLTTPDLIPEILNEFIPMDSKNVHATLAIDAAKFKDIEGNKVAQMFPEIIHEIKDDAIYSNIFVYYLQPININVKPFPIHIQLAENGSANNDTLLKTKTIIKVLTNNSITIDFVATDGDHKYDSLHDDFFEIILEGLKAGLSFKEIVENIISKNILHIPISDFLHSIKILRNNLAKYGIEIDGFRHATVLPEDLENYQMGNTLTDLTQHGKMKDCYPLELFSEKHIFQAFDEQNLSFIYYSLPINLLTNAIRNPYLATNVRKYLLETSFYFLIKLFYDLPNLSSPPHTRIGIIRLINTVTGLYVSLCKYDFVHMGHIGTHPLENYFGFVRIACNYDHSIENIFLAIRKATFVKKLLTDYELTSSIRTRLGYGGTEAKPNLTGGIIPEVEPLELFIKVYKFMLDPSRVEEIEFVKNWYCNFKTVSWNEAISGASAISGTNIVARYVAKSKVAENKQNGNAPVKRSKVQRYESVRNVERSFGLTSDQESGCSAQSILGFLHSIFAPVNLDLSIEKNDLDADEYVAFHHNAFFNSLQSWNARTNILATAK